MNNNEINYKNIPLVELYRPKNFDNIILDNINKKILKNIIETSKFPNLLLYGPPGTGKTTTIINLINSYQEKLNNKDKNFIIHLNASDERGIDIIRNQINNFVNSKPLFNKGMKFVILDEVDYMTKIAQQALKYLIQNNNNDVRYCLICNYISKIDYGLQNEFICLRFNELPANDIINFLNNINNKENLCFSNEDLIIIQKRFNSDIRSMINFMQSNQFNKNQIKIMNSSLLDNLFLKIKNKIKLEIINIFINDIINDYNIDKTTLIKELINHILNNYPQYINKTFLNFLENYLHNQTENININTNYLILKLSQLL